MKTKFVCIMAIASLIVMAVFVGTAAADNGADIYGSRSYPDMEERHNFETTDNLYAWGDFGDYSITYGELPCPTGCGGRIYVVEHKETWADGDTLTDVSSDGFETVAWSNMFFEMAWPTPLDAGTYDLILDLNVSGTGNYYVWTDTPNPGAGPANITDPIWTIYVTGEDPEPIPEFSSIAIPVVSILGLLFFYNYRKRRREG
ncbi:MAG: PEF-CTERM sorting domain-containing protein [Euryarchaeota archaeon]|nr:PEF-CTERM sorting domain-containing protein [Euryarchaeota archaeon]